MSGKPTKESEALLPLKPDVFLILTIIAHDEQYDYGIRNNEPRSAGG